MILSRFDRLDGAGHAYSLVPAGRIVRIVRKETAK
jgi:hypothetical protein